MYIKYLYTTSEKAYIKNIKKALHVLCRKVRARAGSIRAGGGLDSARAEIEDRARGGKCANEGIDVPRNTFLRTTCVRT